MHLIVSKSRLFPMKYFPIIDIRELFHRILFQLKRKCIRMNVDIGWRQYEKKAIQIMKRNVEKVQYTHRDIKAVIKFDIFSAIRFFTCANHIF